MNTKFNLGTLEVKIPAGECNPEINVALKEVTFEVTDLSLTEYAGVMKTIISEVGSQVKDFERMRNGFANGKNPFNTHNAADTKGIF